MMERLTDKYWRNFDPWEFCGQDNYCKRGCHDPGGCRNGCIVPKLYCRLALYEETGLGPEEIKELEAQSKWISVEDRLPTEPSEYIVVIKSATRATTLLFDGSFWFEEDRDKRRTYYAVTHWMPLPEPPKED